jgi:hypothetical protein
MSISGINGTMNNQLFQVATQKNNGQVLPQTQAATQGPTEEGKEGTAVKSNEASQGTEAMEPKSINLYA